jgi:hypothetical protein
MVLTQWGISIDCWHKEASIYETIRNGPIKEKRYLMGPRGFE